MWAFATKSFQVSTSRGNVAARSSRIARTQTSNERHGRCFVGNLFYICKKRKNLKRFELSEKELEKEDLIMGTEKLRAEIKRIKEEYNKSIPENLSKDKMEVTKALICMGIVESLNKVLRVLDSFQQDKESGIKWSEQDSLHLANAILCAEKEWGNESCTAKWLKSLPERFVLQSEQERSKDERMRRSLAEYFGTFNPEDMWDDEFSFKDVVAYLEK